jgi:XTP/dITP diphosphohydrolase
MKGDQAVTPGAPPPLRIVLATRNRGKVAEIRALLEGLPVDLLDAGAFPDAPEVEEDAPTLEGNARKKALALHAHTGLPAVADDTGLEVSALGGRPGVHAARYAGPAADDAANRAKLLREMEGAADRSARFRTVIAFAGAPSSPGTTPEVSYFEGTCEGHLLDAERGRGGFGYDALFVPVGDTRSFAELDPAEKNAVSHRGKALQAFAAALRGWLERT